MVAFLNIEAIKTTLVSHILIKALVEIDEICMAGGEVVVVGGGEGGRSSPPEKQLLRIERKGKQFPLPNTFCFVVDKSRKPYHNRCDVDRLSNNDQLFRFRTLTSC